MALDTEAFAQHNGPCPRSMRGTGRDAQAQRTPESTPLSAQKLPEGYALLTIALHKGHPQTGDQVGIRRQGSPAP